LRKKNHVRKLGPPAMPGGLDLDEVLAPPNPGEDFLSGVEWVTLAGVVRLTTREIVVATLLLHGRTRKSIGHRLKVSPETVRVHIDALFDKFRVKDRLGLALRIARMREVLQAAPESVQKLQSG
jgi:DNA-binding NarL/FixJ family response regulator